FLLMVLVLLCVPSYYALTIPSFPWISIRRLFQSIMIVLFGLALASSSAERERMADTLKANRWLSLCAAGFFIMIFLSIFTSRDRSVSIKELIDSFLNWYVPLAACILVLRTEKDVTSFLRVIAIAGIIDSFFGVIEFALERKIYLDILPA